MKTRLFIAVPLAIAVGCAKPINPTPTPAPTVERFDNLGDALKSRFRAEQQVSDHVDGAAGHFRNILDEVNK